VLAYDCEGAVQTGLHGSQREAHHKRDFPQRKIGVIPQFHQLPLCGGQRHDNRVERRKIFTLYHASQNVVLFCWKRGFYAVKRSLRHATPQLHPAAIRHDAQHPRPKGTALIEAG
jgi:hypothetical protein